MIKPARVETRRFDGPSPPVLERDRVVTVFSLGDREDQYIDFMRLKARFDDDDRAGKLTYGSTVRLSRIQEYNDSFMAVAGDYIEDNGMKVFRFTPESEKTKFDGIILGCGWLILGPDFQVLQDVERPKQFEEAKGRVAYAVWMRFYAGSRLEAELRLSPLGDPKMGGFEILLGAMMASELNGLSGSLADGLTLPKFFRPSPHLLSIASPDFFRPVRRLIMNSLSQVRPELVREFVSVAEGRERLRLELQATGVSSDARLETVTERLEEIQGEIRGALTTFWRANRGWLLSKD